MRNDRFKSQDSGDLSGAEFETPVTCPPGFAFIYNIQPGDTMFLIARRFGISLQELIAANPQVSNPNLIFPGDVLCVPIPLVFPCSIILNPLRPTEIIPPDAGGTALLQETTDRQITVSILAVQVPPPSALGEYDQYEGFINIPGVGGYGFLLFPVGGREDLWAGTLTIPPVLTPETQILVRPVITKTDFSGPAVLQGDVRACL